MSDFQDTGARRVSTGSLPASETVQSLLDDSHARFREVDDGAQSTVYPALSQADPGLFGLTIVGVDGQVHRSGNALAEFTLMSCASPSSSPSPPRTTVSTKYMSWLGSMPLGCRSTPSKRWNEPREGAPIRW